MNKLILCIIALTGFVITSCFESTVAVKIKADGSGTITQNNYINSTEFGAQVGEGMPTPSEEELKEAAKGYGEGVTFDSITEGKNDKGWKGFSVVYTFKDINKIKVSPDAGVNDLSGQNGAENDTDHLSFEFEGKDLKIHIPFEKEEGESDSEGAAMAAAMGPALQGSYVGLTIEIDNGISKTNAKHVEDKTITVLSMELGKVMSDPESIKKMESVNKGTREEAQKISASIDGLKTDIQETISVKFQ